MKKLPLRPLQLRTTSDLSLLVFLFVSFLFLTSCGGPADNQDSTSITSANATGAKDSYLLNEERTFSNNVWNSQSPEVFEVNINEPDDFYSISFSVTIDTAVFRYESFPFYIDIYTPDGAHRHLTTQFPVKQYSRWKGEMLDGYRVVEKQLYEHFPFSKAGKQRIEVKQATSQFNLEGVHAFAINIKKADLDFDKMRNE